MCRWLGVSTAAASGVAPGGFCRRGGGELSPVHMEVMRRRRLVPGLLVSCFRMPLPPPLPAAPPCCAACSRTLASSSGAVAKPAMAREAAPATSGA